MQEFTDFFDDAPVGIHWLGPDGSILRANQAALDSLGYGHEEYVGHHLAEFTIDTEVDDALLRLQAGETLHRDEVRIRCKDGRIKHLLISANARWEAGRFLHSRCFTRESTERRRAEAEIQALLRQQAALGALAHCALAQPDLSILMSELVSLVAQALEVEYAAILELDPSGSSFFLRAGVGWKEGYVSSARVSVGTASQAGYALLSQAPVIVEDLRVEARFSGSALLHDHRVVSGVSVIISGRDGPAGVLSAHTRERRTFTGNDVAYLQIVASLLATAFERSQTEEARRRSEAHYRVLVESVKDFAIFMLDPAGHVINWNAGAERLHGYPVAAVMGQHFSCCYPADEVAAGKPTQALNRAAAQECVEEEGWQVRSDGSRFWAHVVITALRDEDGRLCGFSQMTRDITERERMQEQQEQLRATLQARQEAERYQARRRRRAELQREFTAAILEHVPVGIAVLDPGDLSVRHANAPLLAVLDEPFCHDGVEGQPLTTFLPEIEELGLLPSIRRVAEAGQELVLSDVEFRGFGEGSIYWNLAVTPMRGKDQEVCALVLFVEEATGQVLRRREMEIELERERTIASTLQTAFLPQDLPDCPGYTLGTGYHPALREAGVGGDFYDVFALADGRIGLLLGDVSGKGLAAAVCAMMTRYAVRAYALQMESPGQVLGSVNRALCEASQNPECFVTAIYAVLHPATGTLCYANAGHWPALLAGRQGVQVVGGHALALGISPEVVYTEGQLQLEAEDLLLLFSDGLIEIGEGDSADQLTAVQETLALRRCQPPPQLVRRLYQDALRRCNGIMRDDVALLALRCEADLSRNGTGGPR